MFDYSAQKKNLSGPSVYKHMNKSDESNQKYNNNWKQADKIKIKAKVKESKSYSLYYTYYIPALLWDTMSGIKYNENIYSNDKNVTLYFCVTTII